MKWPVRRVLPAIALALIAIQFVPVPRSNPPVETEVAAPDPVRAVLRRACYDCHSHETVWPWYSRVAPASWMVAYDVREGRSELDFSAWNRIRADERAKKIGKIWKEVAEGEMPPWYYRLAHRGARLSVDDRAKLREWTAAFSPGMGGNAREPRRGAARRTSPGTGLAHGQDAPLETGDGPRFDRRKEPNSGFHS